MKMSKIITAMNISKPEMYVKGLIFFFTFASSNKKKSRTRKARKKISVQKVRSDDNYVLISIILV